MILRFIVIMATIIAGVVITWLRTRKVGQKVDQAINLAVPTGNGFARHTEDQLKEILLQLAEIKPKVDRIETIESKVDSHLIAHSSADVNRKDPS